MKSECPIEIKFILHIFLHEVGHWRQLLNVDRCVEEFMEIDSEREKENHEKSVLLLQKIRHENPKGENNISDDDMAELIRLENEYRKIPKEADADEFARNMMEQMDIESFLEKLDKQSKN